MSTLRDMVGRWKSDIRGLKDLESRCGKQRQWDEARSFQIARETMETAVRELEAALREGRP